MKKANFLLIVLFCFSIISCIEKEEEVEELILAEDSSKLTLSEEIFAFNEAEQVQQLYLFTASEGLTFEITEYPEWIHIDVLSGTINEKMTISLSVNSDFEDFLLENKGELMVETPFETVVISLSYTLVENTSYNLSNPFLDFDYSEEHKTFTISNDGNTDLSYNISSSEDYISVSTEKGIIEEGSSIEVIVEINRDLLDDSRVYNSEIIVEIDDSIETIGVQILNFEEQKLKLEDEIIDAEFSKVTDQMVFVKSDLSLNVFDVSSNEINSISLAYMPTCVSLSLDGSIALVGHDGKFSYVDLINDYVIDVYDVSCYAFDIVLGDNNWAYVFPKDDQWEYIRCVDLDTSKETLSSGNQIYDSTSARLSPNGSYIYTADSGLSPSDMEKIDIRAGVADRLYDSPYHGDYYFGGNFWFSEGGNRVFTRGKTVFKTSILEDQDLIYNGSITVEADSEFNSSYISWLDHSEVNKNLYVITTTESVWDDLNKPYVYVYNSDNLIQKDKIELEKYVVEQVNGEFIFYDAEPHFVFSTSGGEEIFVITKAIESGLNNEWAIQNYEIK